MVEPDAAVASDGLSLDTVMLPLIVVALSAGIGRLPVEASVVPLAGDGIVVVEEPSTTVSIELVTVAESVERDAESSDWGCSDVYDE